MALTEKGRRYVLTADTSQLEAAFKRATRAMNESLKNIRNLNKALKIDPNNINALRQQQLQYNKALQAGQGRAKAMGRQIAELEKLRKKAIDSGKEEDRQSYLDAGGKRKLDSLRAQQASIIANNDRLRESLNRVNKEVLNNSFNKAFKNINSDIREASENAKRLGNAMKMDKSSMVGMTSQIKEYDRAISASADKVKLFNKQLGEMAELRRKAANGSFNAKKDFETLGGEKAFSSFKIAVAESRAELKKLQGEANNVRKTMSNFNFNTKFDKLSAGVKEATNNMRQLKSIMNNGVTLSGLKMEFREVGIAADLTKQKVKALEAEIRQMNRLRSLGSKGDAGAMANFNLKGGEAQLRSLRIELEKTTGDLKRFKQQASTLGQSIGNFKFNQQLEKANQEIKQATANVKQLSSAMNFKGFNGGDASLRFREMNRIIDQTNQKLRLLNQQRVNVKVNSQEFIRLTNEINKSEQEVKELIASMSALERFKLGGFRGLTGGLNQFTQGVQNVSRDMRNIGMQTTMSISMPIGYATQSIVRSAAETDTALRRAAAAGVESGNDFNASFEEVRNHAYSMSQGTVHSAREIATGLEHIIKAGRETKEATGMLPHVMNIATTEGLELGQAAKIMSDNMNAFNLTGEAGAKVLSDVLYTAATESTTGVTEMADALKYAAPLAGLLGFSVQDTSLALALMANNGIEASQAGTALRTGFTELAANAGKAHGELAKFGIEVLDSSGKMRPLKDILMDISSETNGLTEAQRVQAMEMLFGKNAMSGWAAVAKVSGDKIQDLSNKITNSRDAAQNAATALNSGLGGSLKRFSASIENSWGKIGERIAPAVEKILNFVARLVESFANASPAVQQFAVYVAAAAVAFGPLVSAIGWILSPIRRLTQAWMLLKTLMGGGGLNTALAAAGLRQIGTAAATAAAQVGTGAAAGGLAGAMSKLTPILTVGRALFNPWVLGATALGAGLIYAGSKADEWIMKNTQMGRIMSENERWVKGAGVTFEMLGTYIERAKQKAESAQPAFSNIYGNAKVQEQSQTYVETINTAQDRVTEILQRHSQNRTKLTEEEKRTLLQSMQTIRQESAKQLEADMQNFEKTNSTIKTFADKNITDTQAFINQKDNLLKSLDQAYETATQNNQKWYETELHNNSKLPPELQKTTNEITAELDRRNGKVKSAYDKGYQDVMQAYGERTGIETKHMENLKNATNEYSRLADERGKTSEKLAKGELAFAGQVKTANTEIDLAMKEQVTNMAKTFSQMDAKQLAGWFQNIQTARSKGQELSQTTKDALGAISKAADHLPQDLRDKLDTALNAAGLKLDDLKTIAAEKGKETGKAIGDGVKQGAESSDVRSAGNKLSTDLIDSISSKTGLFQGKGSELVSKFKQGAESNSLNPTGSKLINDFLNGMGNKSIMFQGKGREAANATKQGAESTNLNPTGNKLMNDVLNGMGNKSIMFQGKGREVASSTKQGAESVNLNGTGAKMANDMANGFQQNSHKVKTLPKTSAVAAKQEAEAVNFNSTGAKMANDIQSGFSMHSAMLPANASSLMQNAKNAASFVNHTSVGTNAASQIQSGLTFGGLGIGFTESGIMSSAHAQASLVNGTYVGTNAASQIAGGISFGAGSVTGAASGVMNSGHAAAQGVSFNPAGAKTGGEIASGISGGTGAVSGAASSVMNSGHAAAQGVSFNPAGTKASSDLAGGISSNSGSVTGAATSVMNSGHSAAQGVSFNPAGSKASSDLASGINSGSGSVSGAASGVMNSAKGAAQGVSFTDVGSSIIQGIASGINAGWGYLTGLVSNLASSLLAAAKSALNINSPSKKFRDIIGLGIPEGIGVGVNKYSGLAVNSVRSLAKDTINAAKGANIAGRITDTFSSTLATNTSVEHSVRQNSAVVSGINTLIDRINSLELKSDVIMSGEKVGQITYREHQNIERRLSY